MQLAVGLGVGLTRNHKIVAENELPTAGTSDDRAGLLQNGSYFVSMPSEQVSTRLTIFLSLARHHTQMTASNLHGQKSTFPFRVVALLRLAIPSS